jgi:hypothetical protein
MSSDRSAGTAGAISSPSRAKGAGNVSRARSGEKKIGSQPSAISAASATDRGWSDAS